jgi:hypothetical protein
VRIIARNSRGEIKPTLSRGSATRITLALGVKAMGAIVGDYVNDSGETHGSIDHAMNVARHIATDEVPLVNLSCG